MPRALALMALSLFVSLTLTAVVTLLTRPDARRAAYDVASRCRPVKAEEEVLP
jgi:hypothetical protein